MSLRVWLPMTKDLRNQGLDDVTVTNNGATFNSAGKLGGCYYFNGSSTIIFPSYDTTRSIAFWIKSPKTNSTIAFVDYKSKLGFGFQSNGYIIPNCADSSLKMYTADNFIANEWNHIVVTRDDNFTDVTLYINGALQTSRTSGNNNWTNNVDNCYIGGRSTGTNMTCYINDFRVYDHTLSQMEVKELSKGLILHYPLNRGGWGQDNILLNTGFQSRYTQSTGWDTTKNGTQLANSWGGYNSGVTNQATVYHAHLKEFNGEWVYEYVKTANESWLGIAQGGLQSKLTAGETYTFSWEEYHVDGTNRVGTGLYYFKTGATSANFHLGIQQASDIVRVIGKWQKYTYTFVAPSDADWSKSMTWYIYGHYNNNGTFYMRHPKLEKGSIATPWTPNLTDTLATTMGLNSTTEYDCSGFCNNGIKNNSPTYSSDTAKYNVSTHLDGVNQTIQLPNLLTLIPDSIFTFNIWFKRLQSEPSSKPWETLFGGPSGFEIETCSANNVHDNKIRAYSWGGGTIEFEFDKWNMLTMVSNGTNALFYLNGELKLTGTYKALVNGNYFIGSWSNTATQNYKGYVCDARIYATALSADDVKSLYQNSAYIDSSGNIYGAVH